jgi:lipase chaperone LimK
MTEARLKVLEILQEGKISAEDAARLLGALNKTPVDEDDEDIEAQIEEDIEAQVDEDVKMKIKVKMNQTEDA